MRKVVSLFIFSILLINVVSAITINSVETPKLSPGEEGVIRLEIENNLKDDAQDVSISLNLQNLPFVAVGKSEDSIDEIDEGDEEDFTFRIKASNDISPGDYSIPYTIKYFIDDEEKSRTGTIGISVSGKTLLGYTITTESPVIGEKGRLTLTIINREFGDAKFVLVKVFPSGFTLLSDSESYIGNIDSDDFETLSFDVLFTSKNPVFSAIIEYKDFSNSDKKEIINLPIKVYTKEEATALGIIQKSNLGIYITSIIAVILIFILWRTWKKRSRMKKSNSSV